MVILIAIINWTIMLGRTLKDERDRHSEFGNLLLDQVREYMEFEKSLKKD